MITVHCDSSDSIELLRHKIQGSGGIPLCELNRIIVSLSLAPAWSFSAIYYPTAAVARTSGWENGTLLDKSTDLRVSYLFWEADPASSRSSSPFQHKELIPYVRLNIDIVPAYLDHALKDLTLHTEARNSFITFWLPSLLKHQHVALRFLPQKAYEAAASMDVSPAPDVVIRVSTALPWEEARLRAERHVSSKHPPYTTIDVGRDQKKSTNEG
ncbi:hypothetical protein BC835DRAFT_1406495 [Cytidiella melzeri]|nr:hypothetical protein BC835DRAFT_1406495 [Cytidiella melzeri]